MCATCGSANGVWEGLKGNNLQKGPVNCSSVLLLAVTAFVRQQSQAFPHLRRIGVIVERGQARL